MGKKKIKRNKFSLFSSKSNNTIMISIIVVIILMVSIVELFMLVYTRNVVRDVSHNISAEFITNMQSFNIILSQKKYHLLKDTLNKELISTLQVEHVYVTDKKNNEIFSSLPPKSKYIYKIENNPSTFKYIHIPGVNLNEYMTLYINKFNNNVYLLVPNTTRDLVASMTRASKLFFAGIMLMCLLISFVLAKSIQKPLIKMEKTVSQIAQGDLSARLDYTKYYEMNQLVQAYNMMADALQRLYSSMEVKVQDRTKELKNALAELQNAQAMMVHAEKMKSLGELVAGIMHEINNPINFIYGNMTHLSNYSSDLIDVIEKYTQYESSLNENEKSDVKSLKDEIDYEFLKSDMPDLIKSCKEGAERAKNIIQDLKSFSRMEEVAISDVNIPHEIDLTLNILHNKLKNKVEIHKEFSEGFPLVEAFGGQLNQVFMNILDNAVGAIDEKGDIWIKTRHDKEKDFVVIEIEDNGKGMDEETQRKVFNPFFTTKPVGQGTGLGMSITYKIIKNHKGEILVESQEGVGTKFIITLPVHIDRKNLASNLSDGGNNG